MPFEPDDSWLRVLAEDVETLIRQRKAMPYFRAMLTGAFTAAREKDRRALKPWRAWNKACVAAFEASRDGCLKGQRWPKAPGPRPISTFDLIEADAARATGDKALIRAVEGNRQTDADKCAWLALVHDVFGEGVEKIEPPEWRGLRWGQNAGWDYWRVYRDEVEGVGFRRPVALWHERRLKRFLAEVTEKVEEWARKQGGPRPKPGRPLESGDTDTAADRREARAWKKWLRRQRAKGNWHAGFAQYAQEKGKNAREVELRVDRDRKREQARPRI